MCKCWCNFCLLLVVFFIKWKLEFTYRSAVSTHFSEEVADVEMTDAYNFDDDYDAGAATLSSSSGDAQQVVVGSAATVAAAATELVFDVCIL